MPLPKAPTKPATLLQPTDDLIAKPNRNKKSSGRGLAPQEDAEPGLIAGPAVPLSPPQAPPSPGVAPFSGLPQILPSHTVVPRRPAMLRESRRRTDPDVAKTFVLDTNVLMHDPSSLFRFEEHDIFLPMMTLEELDNHKKGVSEVARNVRQVTRSLDAMIEAIADASDGGLNIGEGIPLSVLGNREATGRLYFQTQPLEIESSPSIEGLTVGKADNQILGVVRALQAKQKDRLVVLVSKDINIRIKAHALGLPAEDYFNDQVIDDADLLYSGAMQLPEGFWDSHGKRLESWQQGGYTFYRVTGPLCAAFHVNQFVYEEGASPLYALVQEVQGRTAVLRTLRDFTHAKNSVWGITARNREQNFALNLLMNPDVDFVTLLGQAGTGKTLLALASGLAQILETKIYNEIIVTRATVPLGDDIGFLPGTEEEKMQPWMGALEDNLEVLNRGVDGGGDWGRSAAADLIRTRIKIKSLNFMRGRTFINKFLIIDEAQNLTPKQMKALITRAGPGTKVVCMGNIAQIDSPYLTEGSSGLTYVVDRFKGWSHGGHVTLQRGERSRLADFATEAL
ncbi:MAG: PhoH family protein [Betaproteobacteria bacterium]|nr:PhoH family protein [Betaproteobacteria bacterium]